MEFKNWAVNRRDNIKDWIINLFDYERLLTSCQEVIWLTVFAFGPLILNILIISLSTHDFPTAFRSKIIPGEMISYSFSFIAPLLYLIVKTHGEDYKLPLIKTIFIITLFIYVAITLILIVAKNQLLPDIDFKSEHRDLFFSLSLIFLGSTILLRLYSIYHNGNFSKHIYSKDKGEKSFTAKIKKRINQGNQ
jgi:hypothetical protein